MRRGIKKETGNSGRRERGSFGKNMAIRGIAKKYGSAAFAAGIGLLLFFQAASFWGGLSATKESVRLRLAQPMSVREAAAALDRAGQEEGREKDGGLPGFCIWGEEKDALLENVSLGRTAQADAVVLCGDPELALPGCRLPAQGDGDGCVVDEAAAWDLFGDKDVVGKEVRCEGQSYVVREVIPGERGLIAWQADLGGILKDTGSSAAGSGASDPEADAGGEYASGFRTAGFTGASDSGADAGSGYASGFSAAGSDASDPGTDAGGWIAADPGADAGSGYAGEGILAGSEEKIFSRVTIRNEEGEEESVLCEEWESRTGRPAEILDLTMLRGIAGFCVLLFPVTVCVFSLSWLYRCCWKTGGTQGKLAAAMAGAVICLILAAALRARVEIPFDYIPSRWSDFSFWAKLWEEKKAAAAMLWEAQKSSLDGEWAAQFAKSAGCGLLAEAFLNFSILQSI